MSQPRVMTRTQAKREINHFGRALIIYILLLTLYRYGGVWASDLIASMFPKSMVEAVTTTLMIAATVLSIIPFFLTARLLKLRMRDYFKEKRKMSLGVYIQYVSLGIGIQLIVTTLATVFNFVNKSSTTINYLGDFHNKDLIILNIVYFIYYVIIKPICDEYVFRGVIQRTLGHFGRGFGVVASALLYALAQGNLMDAIPAFFMGWFFSVITLRFHSLIPTMKVAMGISLFFYIADIIPAKFFFVVLIVIVLNYIFIGILLITNRIDSRVKYSQAFDLELWEIFLSSYSIIICIILFVVNVILSLFIKGL
ncbi:MAG: CPBP family intramembrane metalloprotease [Erysipelotrichaceae bacterium]|nr:CPBP family intramembrane metalloprotease [Erysipelotrichaceae bacterium]